MARVLIVADGREAATDLGAMLLSLGYGVTGVVSSGKVNDHRHDEPDLVILLGEDVGLMQKAAAAVRRAEVSDGAPILAVFIRQVSTHELAAMSGVDDFVFLPVSPAELNRRIVSLQSRRSVTEQALAVGGLRLDDARRRVTIDGRPLTLTRKEYYLLKLLVTHRGRVLSRQELLEQVWLGRSSSSTRTVDVHIRRLRMKLGPEYAALIQTVRQEGYLLAAAGEGDN